MYDRHVQAAQPSQPTDTPLPTRLGWLRQLLTVLLLLTVTLTLWVASGLLIPTVLQPLSIRLQGLVTIFLGIFIEALPFLLAGVFASSAIHVFVSPERIRTLSPRSPVLAALSGALLGLAFPVCECGSVPMTRRLLAKGASLPLGIAFVLAAPAVNPIVIISTWVAFSSAPQIVVGRIGLTVLIATVIGVVLGIRATPEQLLAPTNTAHNEPHEHTHDAPAQRWGALLTHAIGEFFEMSRFLVLGALIAATLQTVVPREALLAIGAGPIRAPLVMMALAFVLSICSTVDAFIALAFVNSFPPGALLAFLVFGPMVDIKSVLMFTTTFRRRTVAHIVMLAAVMSFAAGVLINLL
jgi:uncharacterized protein